MRLQLSCAALLILAAPLTLAADSDVGARLDLYSDEWITVVNQATAASVTTPEGLSARGHYAVDAISGATRAYAVDAMSGATTFSETRVEGGVEVGASPWRDVRVVAGYLRSHEPDYDTHALSLQAEADLFARMSTVGVGLGVSLEQLGRVDRPWFHEEALGTSLDLSWAQVLSKGTLLKALFSTGVLTCGPAVGCNASPYRFVPVVLTKEGAADVSLALGERHPALRARSAAGLRLSQSIRSGFAVHGGYRGYVDTWGVVGHTLDVAGAAAFDGGRGLVRVEGRSSWQSAASFYEPALRLPAGAERLPRYRTSDIELSGLHSLVVGASLSWTAPSLGVIPPLRPSVRLSRLWYRYPDFPALPSRDAWLVGGGLATSF